MMFDEAVIFTDIHFGLKNNSRSHNIDCENFIIWMIEEAQKRGVKKCFFLGDWHHHRATINVSTLNYTTSNLQRLNDNFDEVIMITGNHDLYYREKREIHSIPMVEKFPKIRMVNDEMLIEDGVAFVPWLVDDEYRKLKKLKVEYIFGHFELPSFYMNAMVQMPDHGNGIRSDDLSKASKVFSGHFHKRQQQGNIIYPGNCFPHNYSDAWDDERGITFLKWGGDHDFMTWPDAPKYRTIALSKLIDRPDEILSPNTHCRVSLDVPISYEEANFIKETFAQQYSLREISLIPDKKEEHSREWSNDAELEIENVDSIVLSQLSAIDSPTIKNKMLIDIYNGLHT
jgi:DNA repair exonuclease SbcCD nuclease subunit|tara:strand:- start:5974 stop:6999 length:1026 start_codon:yes stop_codon:yes gene_type:complete